MLYDPKRWGYKPQNDPFSLESLIAWLETKNPREAYCLACPRTCLMGQWVSAVSNLQGTQLGYKSITLTNSAPENKPFKDTAFTAPYTFGAALKRAKAMRAAQAVPEYLLPVLPTGEASVT